MEEKKVEDVNYTEIASDKPEKMSYEQLNNVAHQLSAQVEQLWKQLQQANMANIFKRLDYLFKVIENKDNFSKEFTENCVQEVVTIMTPPKEEEEEKA